MKLRITSIIILAFCLLGVCIGGCSPTYSKEKIEESIIKICKKEYSADVKVKIAGKTIAIYLPLSDLLDFTFAITKPAGEKINDVILSVSRVCLSTDAKFNFYCLIAHDVRIPEIQIVIIKSVDDVKRFLLNDISRGEYSRRMLIDIRLNPQSQKEHAVKEVFSKMNLDPQWQDEVMNDFFRGEATALGDIGYWNGRFYIKDVSLPEFLTEQIAGRVRNEFREDRGFAENLLLKSSKGNYYIKEGKGYFKLEILAEPKIDTEWDPNKTTNKIFRKSLKIANDVIHGYRFKDFDFIEIVNLLDGRNLLISRSEMELLRLKKIKFEDVSSTF